MSGRIAFVLTAMLVLCALSVVNAHYQSRSAFIALEREQAKTRQIEIDWRQLQLDQSTLGVHGRIEANARRDLRMVPASPSSTQYLNLEAK